MRSEEVKLIVRSSLVSHSAVGILTPGGACCGELVPGLTVEKYSRSECTDKAENVIEIRSFICENHSKSVLPKILGSEIFTKWLVFLSPLPASA